MLGLIHLPISHYWTAMGKQTRPTQLIFIFFYFDERMCFSLSSPDTISLSLSVTVSLSTLFWTLESPSDHLFQGKLIEVGREGFGCKGSDIFMPHDSCPTVHRRL